MESYRDVTGGLYAVDDEDYFVVAEDGANGMDVLYCAEDVAFAWVITMRWVSGKIEASTDSGL